MSIDHSEFDYIVVGAGSAGCVMASRLSEDPNASVLLVEAGPKDTSFWLHIPIGYGRTIADEKVNWKYDTIPNPALNGRSIYLPRGRVMGGSSSINGLIYIRGQAEDYDHWRQLGNTGWGYRDVLPYFKKAEDQENGADEYHGVGGPLSVTNLREVNPLVDAYIDAAVEVGIPRNPDFNGATQEGVGYFQGTIKKGRRASASQAYLKHAKSRANLTIVTNSLAKRILFKDKRAVGLEFEENGAPRTVHCRKEVVVSTGSINSPQLLMLSGIGPADHLREHGIEVQHDLPGVGQNLQDHYGGQIAWKCSKPITLNDVMMSKWKQLMVGVQWLLFRNGPLSVPAGQASLFTKILENSATPDVQFLFQTLSGGYYEDGLFKFSGFANFICPVRPESRGHITLQSAKHTDSPAIFPNYFSAEKDRQIAVGGLKLARKMAETTRLGEYIIEENLPGSAIQSDDEIEQYFKENGGSVSHQIGTCKMGSDPMAVVDSELRVHGVEGLRVVDASVMPKLISGNTNAATIMIGEKGADMVKQSAKGALASQSVAA